MSTALGQSRLTQLSNVHTCVHAHTQVPKEGIHKPTQDMSTLPTAAPCHTYLTAISIQGLLSLYLSLHPLHLHLTSLLPFWISRTRPHLCCLASSRPGAV